jgi:hypothetical protein
MARIFDYAPNGSYAFDWNAQPKLNDPIYESPVPCRAGYDCCYTGVCSFVHPGEEGLGRRIFYARSADEKDVVRIFGQPHKKATFYERRRLRLSWPEWCRRNGLPAPVAPVVSAPSHKRKQVIDLSEAPVEAKAAPAPSAIAPSAIAQPAFDQAAYAQWQAECYRQQCEAYYQQVIAAGHAAAQAQQDFGLANWALYEQAVWAKGPFSHMGMRQSYGELLFAKVAQALEENRDFLKEQGWLTEKTTAGKIVGMLLDGYNDEELDGLYGNLSQLCEAICDACEILVEAAKAAKPVPAPEAKAPEAPTVIKSVAFASAPIIIQGAWGDIVD